MNDEASPIRAARLLSKEIEIQVTHQKAFESRVEAVQGHADNIRTLWESFRTETSDRCMHVLGVLQTEGILHSNYGVASIVHSHILKDQRRQTSDDEAVESWYETSIHLSGGVGTLSLKHKIHTSFEQCGLQLWQGALLLTDFILARPELFVGGVIELGCGVGLTAMVLARATEAGPIWMTDYEEETLQNCRGNIAANGCGDGREGRVLVCHLDWDDESTFPWNEQNHLGMKTLIAADVTYDDYMKGSISKVVTSFFGGGSDRQAYIAMEIRDLSENPQDEEFKRALKECRLRADAINLSDIPLSSMCYRRGPALQLWKISPFA